MSSPPRRRQATDVFVGRRPELDAFAAAWQEARSGEPRLVRVEGEPGSGKTALIARCVAEHPGATVLSASGDEGESRLAYGVLDQLVAGLPRQVADQFPLVRPDRTRRADPLAIGADLLGALGALPGEEPVLLVVDDVQWVDEPSTRALLFVLRRLQHDHVVALIGVRLPGTDPDTPEPDPRWDRLLGPGRGARRLRLAGLPPGELSELAAVMGHPLGSTGAAERLFLHTGGHPLYARALLEELPAEVLAGTTDDLPAPRSLTAVVLVRLARAAPDTEALVVAASVLGTSCTLGHAAAVGGVTDPSAALDEAVRIGLLTERPGSAPARIGFAHPLLRAAVHGDLAPARRRTLHAAAAGLLPGREGLAHRVAAAAGADPALAAELEAAAAAAGVPGTEAADLLRAAADLSLDPGDRQRRLLAAVRRLIDEGEIARATALEGAVAQTAPGRRRTEMLGQLALYTGRFARARDLLESAHDPDDPAVGPEASAHLALLTVLEGDTARGVRLGAAALAVAGTDPGVRMPAGFAVVLGLAAEGRGADAIAVLDRAAAAGDGRSAAPGPAPGAPDRGRMGPDLLVMRGMLAALAADDAAAHDALDEAVRRARSGEPIRMLALALTWLPVVRDHLGQPGVVDGLELAASVTRDGGTVLPGTLVHAFTAEALAVRGRTAQARTHLGDPSEPSWWGAELCGAVAAAVLARVDGDPDAMLRALAPALRPDLRGPADGLGHFGPRVLEVEAHLAGGRAGQAAEALAELESRLAGRPVSRYTVDAARLALLVAEATGGPDPAPPSDATWSVPAPLAIARLETELGRRLLASGERRAGLDLLRTARDRLDRLDAAPLRARCDALLHDAGLTPPAADDALGLTPHEQAVVTLVARGLTNREAAQHLFVTQRTVAYHLSNVYAKLGITSRRELRALAAS